MRNRSVAMAMAMATLTIAGVPSANIVPAQTVAQAGASQEGPQGQQNRLPSTSNFLGALLDGGSFGYKPFRPTYRKRPHGSVARDKRDARRARNRRRSG